MQAGGRTPRARASNPGAPIRDSPVTTGIGRICAAPGLSSDPTCCRRGRALGAQNGSYRDAPVSVKSWLP